MVSNHHQEKPDDNPIDKAPDPDWRKVGDMVCYNLTRGAKRYRALEYLSIRDVLVDLHRPKSLSPRSVI
jgi:hypothetical protein